MYILGISAYYHDAAAALLHDGRIVAAAQEERFTRRKHDKSFPAHAIRGCLNQAGITASRLDHIVFYDKPLQKFDRLLETYLSYAPRGWASFRRAISIWLTTNLHLPRIIKRELLSYKGKVLFTEHHEAHAASAFFPSPYPEAAVICFDGVGEWTTTSWGVGRGRHVDLKEQIVFPHSLGMLYSAFTQYAGFKVNSGEYKLMGLAPYGKPKYADLILERLLDLREDGSFRLRMEYFDYCQGLTMTNRRFHDLFGAPPREPESELTQKEMDVAASAQRVTEEIVLCIGRYVHERTSQKRLCLAGGVALNCVANGRLLREGPYEKIWIQPAAGDAGGALGAALAIWHHYLDQPREVDGIHDLQRGSYLGPGFSSEDIRDFLGDRPHRELPWDELLEEVVDRLTAGQVVGWFQGQMEFGPRALGARSILGDPRNPEMQHRINLKIKFRESFRPFAPAVLVDQANEWFEHPGPSPYMLYVGPVRDAKRTVPSPEATTTGLGRVRAVRSEVPAVTHLDYSARLQTVDGLHNPRFYQLLQRFFARTGCPMLVNTSFNVRGEPIVCTPADAYRCFMATEMDALVLEDVLLEKRAQPAHDRHVPQPAFALD